MRKIFPIAITIILSQQLGIAEVVDVKCEMKDGGNYAPFQIQYEKRKIFFPGKNEYNDITVLNDKHIVFVEFDSTGGRISTLDRYSGEFVVGWVGKFFNRTPTYSNPIKESEMYLGGTIIKATCKLRKF